MKKLFIKSYGCQMNVYDSDRITDLMRLSGYEITNSLYDANLVILNTCHIREKASEKVYSEIGRIEKIKNTNLKKDKDYKLIIAGCVAQAEGEEIKARAPSVDAIVGPQNYHTLPQTIKRIERKNKIEINTNFLAFEKFDNLIYDNSNKSSSFITIQEGCDKFCTFCVVPYTRGSEYSRPISDIINEAKNYAEKGSKEIILLGQNVNSYHGKGIDKKEKKLDYLINKISEIDSIKRIGYMTSHPIDIYDDLINCHKTNSKLMPYLHLPIQSGSDFILKKMNRKYTVKSYLNIIEKFKKAREDIAFSSDFIIGFPGETDDDFKKTIDLIKIIEFANGYSFIYSPRPGTPASNLNNDVNDKISRNRLQILQNVIKNQQKKYNKKFIGKKINVLFEKKGKHKNQFIGKSIYNQSVFKTNKENIIGKIMDVNINGVTTFALSAN